MIHNRILIYLFLLNLIFIFGFNTFTKASEKEKLMCDGDFTDYIYQNDDDNFEYLEKRNDIGIFYDFAWHNEEKKIIIKRDKNNYPIVKFSLFEKKQIIPGKTSIKTFNSIDLSKLNDSQLEKLITTTGEIIIELTNNDKIQIFSKPYELNNFKLSDFKIISIQNIDTSKGILEMSFDSKLTNVRKDIYKILKNKPDLLEEYRNSAIDICDEFKNLATWPLMSVEFDEFKYDADVREGLKNKEKLTNPVFEIIYDNNEIRTLRTEKGVGYFRQSFDFKKFPFDKQKLIIRINTGVSNSKDFVTFVTPEPGVFINLNKFIEPEINKLKAWSIIDNGIEVKNNVLIENDYYDIYSKKIVPRSLNYLEIEIILKRNFQHYLFKIMFPVFLILCVAWYVLWIPTEKYEARLNTSIIALLALIAYNFVFQDDIPKLEYLTDLDWFILLSYIFCLIPVFLSIAFSKFISKNQKKVTKINKFIKIWGGILYLLITIQIFNY